MSEQSKVSSVFGLDVVLARVVRGCCVVGRPVDVAGAIPDYIPASCDVSSSENSAGCSGDGVGSSGSDDGASCCCSDSSAFSCSMRLIGYPVLSPVSKKM